MIIVPVVSYAAGTGRRKNIGDNSLYIVVDDTYIKDVQIYLNRSSAKKGISTITTLFLIKDANAKHRQEMSPQNMKSTNKYIKTYRNGFV